MSATTESGVRAVGLVNLRRAFRTPPTEASDVRTLRLANGRSPTAHIGKSRVNCKFTPHRENLANFTNTSSPHLQIYNLEISTLAKCDACGQTIRKPKPEKEGDPRHKPLIDGMVHAFEVTFGGKYPFTGKDARSVSALLVLASPPEVLSRWRNAILTSGYPKVRTISELLRHWAHFAGVDGRGPVDPTTQGWDRSGTAKKVDF